MNRWPFLHAMLAGITVGSIVLYTVLVTGPGGPTSEKEISPVRLAVGFTLYAVCLAVPLILSFKNTRRNDHVVRERR